MEILVNSETFSTVKGRNGTYIQHSGTLYIGTVNGKTISLTASEVSCIWIDGPGDLYNAPAVNYTSAYPMYWNDGIGWSVMAPVYEKFYLSEHRAYALPSGITVQKGDKYNIGILRHEFGHYLQAKELGSSYYTKIAIPSLKSARAKTYDQHM